MGNKIIRFGAWCLYLLAGLSILGNAMNITEPGGVETFLWGAIGALGLVIVGLVLDKVAAIKSE